MKIINAKDLDKLNNIETLSKQVKPDNDLKNYLVQYVGQKREPEDQHITVEMIIEVLAAEFPEFVLAVAEENWVRGYQQALDDVEIGRKIVTEENKEKDVRQKSCKLCEK